MNIGTLGVRLQVDPPGVIITPSRADPHVVIHVGPSVEIGCERGGQIHHGLSVHGDVDIVPAGVASRWVLKEQDCALIVRVSRELLREVAGDLGIEPAQAVLRNRFQVRDPTLEFLAWALKAEMDHSCASGRLFQESVAVAMACRLLQKHSLAHFEAAVTMPGGMSAFRLRRVVAYVEDNLGGDLSLQAIASVSGLSVSHCQRAFRGAIGLSVHQYVIRRRVERARSLLVDKKLALSEVALTVGFSHQSHLAYQMRRLLGVSPMTLRKLG